MAVFGFEATILSKARAGSLGRVRPCSQFCSVRKFTPISFANRGWLKFVGLRIAWIFVAPMRVVRIAADSLSAEMAFHLVDALHELLEVRSIRRSRPEVVVL